MCSCSGVREDKRKEVSGFVVGSDVVGMVRGAQYVKRSCSWMR